MQWYRNSSETRTSWINLVSSDVQKLLCIFEKSVKYGNGSDLQWLTLKQTVHWPSVKRERWSVGEGGMKEGICWFCVCVCVCVLYIKRKSKMWETRLKEELKVTLKYHKGEKRQTRKSRHRHVSPEVCVLIEFPCSCCILYSTEWSGCDELEIWRDLESRHRHRIKWWQNLCSKHKWTTQF